MKASKQDAFFNYMSYIIACVLSSTSIFLIFRWSKDFSCQLANLISLNYFFASLFGYIFILKFRLTNFPVSTPWMPEAIILGTLFMVLFLVIGYSSQKAGVAVTSLSNKLSLPIWWSFNLLHLNLRHCSQCYWSNVTESTNRPPDHVQTRKLASPLQKLN